MALSDPDPYGHRARDPGRTTSRRDRGPQDRVDARDGERCRLRQERAYCLRAVDHRRRPRRRHGLVADGADLGPGLAVRIEPPGLRRPGQCAVALDPGPEPALALARSSKTGGLAAAASGSERISPSPSSDTSQRPSGMRPTYGPSTSLKKRAVSAVDNSMASTDSGRRFTVIVASPAARKLRTQLTSPNGLCTQRRPLTSTSATGVVRSWPLLRPRTVSKALGPSGVPIRSRRLAIGLKIDTKAGTCAGRPPLAGSRRESGDITEDLQRLQSND